MIVVVQMLITVPFRDHVDRNREEPSFKLAGPEAIEAAMDCAPNADQEKKKCTSTLEVSPLVVEIHGLINNIEDMR
jgi:hypothetical protein